MKDYSEIIWENQDAILRQFKGWKAWYCKKNQPLNYIRLMCRKDPTNPDNTYFWICRLQVFVKNKFEYDIRITADAYRRFPRGPGWSDLEVRENGNYEYRIYKNPNANELGAED